MCVTRMVLLPNAYMFHIVTVPEYAFLFYFYRTCMRTQAASSLFVYFYVYLMGIYKRHNVIEVLC